MKNYEFESEDMNFDDSSSMDFLSDSMSEFDLCDRMLEPESVVPSVDRNLVNLFLEYRTTSRSARRFEQVNELS